MNDWTCGLVNGTLWGHICQQQEWPLLGRGGWGRPRAQLPAARQAQDGLKGVPVPKYNPTPLHPSVYKECAVGQTLQGPSRSKCCALAASESPHYTQIPRWGRVRASPPGARLTRHGCVRSVVMGGSLAPHRLQPSAPAFSAPITLKVQDPPLQAATAGHLALSLPACQSLSCPGPP